MLECSKSRSIFYEREYILEYILGIYLVQQVIFYISKLDSVGVCLSILIHDISRNRMGVYSVNI